MAENRHDESHLNHGKPEKVGSIPRKYHRPAPYAPTDVSLKSCVKPILDGVSSDRFLLPAWLKQLVSRGCDVV